MADDYVDPKFGTGIVKITPAHDDPNDFEIGLRHNLPQVQVIGLDAAMTDEAGKYAGQDRYECRRQIVSDLEAMGLLVKIEDHRHAVGQCYRCNTVVEPLVSKQWFVKMKPLAGGQLSRRWKREKFVSFRNGSANTICIGWKICGTGAFLGSCGGGTPHSRLVLFGVRRDLCRY